MKGKGKQAGRGKKANAVLQKYKVAVEDFVKGNGTSEDVDHTSDFRYIKKKSRKELRKEKRKLKKAKMKSHYEGKRDFSPPSVNKTNPVKEKNRPKNKSDKQNASLPNTSLNKIAVKRQKHPKQPSTQKDKKPNKLQESRKQALLEANEQEDREIKKLERSLGLNKRKNKKSLPQSFVADGLDYILGVLDAGSTGAAMYDSEEDMDLARDNFSKLEEEESNGSDNEEHKMSSEEDNSSESLDDENDMDSLNEDMGGDEEACESEDDLNESNEEEKESSMASEVEDEDDTVDALMTGENTQVRRISISKCCMS